MRRSCSCGTQNWIFSSFYSEIFNVRNVKVNKNFNSCSKYVILVSFFIITPVSRSNNNNKNDPFTERMHIRLV